MPVPMPVPASFHRMSHSIFMPIYSFIEVDFILTNTYPPKLDLIINFLEESIMAELFSPLRFSTPIIPSEDANTERFRLLGLGSFAEKIWNWKGSKTVRISSVSRISNRVIVEKIPRQKQNCLISALKLAALILFFPFFLGIKCLYRGLNTFLLDRTKQPSKKIIKLQKTNIQTENDGKNKPIIPNNDIIIDIEANQNKPVQNKNLGNIESNQAPLDNKNQASQPTVVDPAENGQSKTEEATQKKEAKEGVKGGAAVNSKEELKENPSTQPDTQTAEKVVKVAATAIPVVTQNEDNKVNLDDLLKQAKANSKKNPKTALTYHLRYIQEEKNTKDAKIKKALDDVLNQAYDCLINLKFIERTGIPKDSKQKCEKFLDICKKNKIEAYDTKPATNGKVSPPLATASPKKASVPEQKKNATPTKSPSPTNEKATHTAPGNTKKTDQTQTKSEREKKTRTPSPTKPPSPTNGKQASTKPPSPTNGKQAPTKSPTKKAAAASAKDKGKANDKTPPQLNEGAEQTSKKNNLAEEKQLPPNNAADANLGEQLPPAQLPQVATTKTEEQDTNDAINMSEDNTQEDARKVSTREEREARRGSLRISHPIDFNVAPDDLLGKGKEYLSHKKYNEALKCFSKFLIESATKKDINVKNETDEALNKDPNLPEEDIKAISDTLTKNLLQDVKVQEASEKGLHCLIKMEFVNKNFEIPVNPIEKYNSFRVQFTSYLEKRVETDEARATKKLRGKFGKISLSLPSRPPKEKVILLENKKILVEVSDAEKNNVDIYNYPLDLLDSPFDYAVSTTSGIIKKDIRDPEMEDRYLVDTFEIEFDVKGEEKASDTVIDAVVIEDKETSADAVNHAVDSEKNKNKSTVKVKMHLFAIFDGHSVETVQAKDQEITPWVMSANYLKDVLKKEFETKTSLNDLNILNVLEHIPSKLHEKIKFHSSLGTTMSFAILFKHPETDKDTVCICNLGDSRVNLRVGNKCKQLTTDARYRDESKDVNKADRKFLNGIKKRDGFISKGVDGVFRLAGMSKSQSLCFIGNHASGIKGISRIPEVMVFDLSQIESYEDAILFLGTPGVWDVIGSQEAVNITKDHRENVGKAANTLVEYALKAKKDNPAEPNTTVIAVNLRPQKN